MSYKRKTKDKFEIITNYGYGEEIELTEDSLKEAKERVKEYLDNASGLLSIRIKRSRERIENET